eukprot:GHVL01028046.1.p1 GENE.GHVL01028046.1~~GHVL01028046.1.p1  ORF type:complete len:244 (+),score=39.14 GHVL01028046.1:959-1690(+)
MTMDDYRKRKHNNKILIEEGTLRVGTQVDACSQGDWLEGIVRELIDEAPGRLSARVRLEDGNEEILDVAMIIPAIEDQGDDVNNSEEDRHKRRKKKKKRSSSRGRKHRSRSRSVSKEETERWKPSLLTQEDARREFMKREQNKAIATGKDYARRPTSYKSSLSLRVDTATRRRSRSPEVKINQVPPKTTSSSRPEKQHSSSGPSWNHQKKIASLMAQYTKGQDNRRGSKDRRDVEGPDTVRID